MGLLRLYLDYFEIITNIVRYDYTYLIDHPIFARYTPSRDTIHSEDFQYNQHHDYTNTQGWNFFYYPRRHQNIPDNENIYDVYLIWYGANTDTLWALIEIILDI